MKLYSTNNKSLRVEFKEAVFNSLPADNGLYMPVEIPILNRYFLDNIHQYSLQEIALEVASALLGDAIPKEDLKKIVDEAINFDVPMRFLTADTVIMELFHGPSFAFKDFGARFMSRVMGYLSDENEKDLDVLVATSGDTGGAVALGFLGVKGTRVTILYPKGKVSEIQELQLTTNGQNIRAIEVNGTFDDCQAMVKKAFLDEELNQKLRLTSANSINIARLIPQTFYYFYAFAMLKSQGVDRMVLTVPSGNFGNIAAGVLAWKMGLLVYKFVAATNSNDTVPRFLESGEYAPHPTMPTLSNAMDVSNPSNWVRIMDMFDGELSKLKRRMSSYCFDDDQTKAAILELEKEHDYIACPHTAVAYLASQQFRKDLRGNYASVIVSTAHPCKFPNAYTPEQWAKITIPESVEKLRGKEKLSVEMEADFNELKKYLLAEKG